MSFAYGHHFNIELSAIFVAYVEDSFCAQSNKFRRFRLTLDSVALWQVCRNPVDQCALCFQWDPHCIQTVVIRVFLTPRWYIPSVLGYATIHIVFTVSRAPQTNDLGTISLICGINSLLF
jgi:hypothetical protein